VKKFLIESPDIIDVTNKEGNNLYLSHRSSNAYPFFYNTYRNELLVGEAKSTHRDLCQAWNINYKTWARYEYKNSGRFWKQNGIISFWNIPTYNILRKIITQFKKSIDGFNIRDWLIELRVEHIKDIDQLTPIYAGESYFENLNTPEDFEDNDDDNEGYEQIILVTIADYLKNGRKVKIKEFKPVEHQLSPLLKKSKPKINMGYKVKAPKNLTIAQWNALRQQEELKKVKTFLKESLATLEKKFPNISKSDLKRIWEADPSGNNHWSKKIAQFYSEGVVGLGPILITIERYHNLTQRAKGAQVSVKDINSFNTYSTFDSYVNQLETQVKKKAERFKKKQAYETVHEDSDWYVLYPQDFDTLATLGKDSDWCTAKRESTYNSYKKNGEFLIIIDKKLFKEYKENSIPKEDRSSDYKWLLYGKFIIAVINNIEKLTLRQEELANLKNKHKKNKEIDKIILKLDLEKIIEVDKSKLDKHWYNSNGDLHREDGPAKVSSNDKFWYQNGNLSRDDGPAIEFASGTKVWRIDGKLHRENGPAVEYDTGTKIWYQNGDLHREDGPAKEWTDGTKEWYLNDKNYSEKDWKVELIKRGLKVPK